MKRMKGLLYSAAIVFGALLPEQSCFFVAVLLLVQLSTSEYYQQRVRAQLPKSSDGEPLLVVTRVDVWIMEGTRVFTLIFCGSVLRLASGLLIA